MCCDISCQNALTRIALKEVRQVVSLAGIVKTKNDNSWRQHWYQDGGGVMTIVCAYVWAWVYKYLTSVQCWPQSGPCRCYWQAGRRSPSRRGRSASYEILGWAYAGCHKQSWNSRRHGGAGSHNRSPYWCCTPVSLPYCSLEDSRKGKKACFNLVFFV